MRKLLVICSTLDLDLPHGATPWLWQFYKALYEVGCELIVVPYRGRAIRSLWWRCSENPCRLEGNLYAKFNTLFRRIHPPNKANKDSGEGLAPKLARIFTLPKWKHHMRKLIEKESGIEGILFVQVPLNQIRGLASSIKKEFDLPSFYYETDVPTSLPEYGGFYFNHFLGGDLSEFEAFIIPSEGSRQRLIEMGANRVYILHFGVDPAVYIPIETDYSIDVFFSGIGSRNREESINSLIVIPSKETNADFAVSGQGYEIDLGNVRKIPPVPFSSWRRYCCASRINLNIPRKNHAFTYATSTSRPFELAAMKCCVVSSKYLGLEKWFDLDKEILVAENSEEAKQLYLWLLSDDDERLKLAENARERVLRDHTAEHRAKELLGFLDEAERHM